MVQQGILCRSNTNKPWALVRVPLQHQSLKSHLQSVPVFRGHVHIGSQPKQLVCIVIGPRGVADHLLWWQDTRILNLASIVVGWKWFQRTKNVAKKLLVYCWGWVRNENPILSAQYFVSGSDIGDENTDWQEKGNYGGPELEGTETVSWTPH